MAHRPPSVKPPLEDFLSNLEQTRIANGEPLCNHMGCTIPPLKGEAFCAKHMTDIDALIKRLSGSEPPYKPELWNDNRYVQMVHNCFAYALNILSDSLAATCKKENICNTHQPGEKSKWLPMKEKTCPNLIARIFGDDTYTPIEFHEKCPKGTSMVAFIIDEVRDYHVLRLDTTGYFSHKGGQGPATDKDARGHKIADALSRTLLAASPPTKPCLIFLLARLLWRQRLQPRAQSRHPKAPSTLWHGCVDDGTRYTEISAKVFIVQLIGLVGIIKICSA